MTGDTLDKIKGGLKETAEGVKEGVEEVTDSDTYTGSEHEREKRDYNESGGKEPMNLDDIASQEPTAVKRDKKQGTSGDPV